MKLGIVGLSQAGKTTIFNALTRREGESVPAGGQPVPVLGAVPVPDDRVVRLSAMYNPKKTTFAQVTYLDLQGNPGSTDNKQEYMALLLNHMRPMDAFLMTARNFPHPVLGDPHPLQDVSELEDEFLISDLATVEKRLERLAVDRKRGKDVSATEQQLLEQCLTLLNEGVPLRAHPEVSQAPELRGFTFLSAKPLLVVFNNDDEDPDLPEGDLAGTEAMVVRGRLEMEMAQLSEEEARSFQEDFGIQESAVNRVIERSFALLRLITFLTVGEDEVKAWTTGESSPALEAAGEIHSDIKKGFIRAEVVAYEDLMEAGNYAAAKKQGTVRLEGKTYPVKDGDIIHFRFNV